MYFYRNHLLPSHPPHPQGHARTYVAFDNVRLALEDWFGYDVALVMNVTDVDDKIIRRAREGHLLAAYSTAPTTTPAVARADAAAAVEAAIAAATAKVEAATAEAKAAADAAAGENAPAGAKRAAADLAEAAAGEAHKLSRLRDAAKAVASAPDDVASIVAAGADALGPALDASSGATLTDPSIFRAHAARYEADFLADMDELRVRRPAVLTRVSEYVPEIVDYVSTIISAGFAYATSTGDVYFDVAAFRGAGWPYGRLRPHSVGTGLGGDGDDSAPAAATADAAPLPTTKRSPADFALWKASRPGEPSWASPWGRGRPGWHIECSAMACAVLGPTIDIHSGGEDLAFPHHDNEIAQADAFYSGGGVCGCGGGGRVGGTAPADASPTTRQWVNYFLHSGHLSIDGLKMSKSLKNFVTIRDALAAHSPRLLRLLFAGTRWDKPMTFNAAALDEARKREGAFKRLFHTVAVAGRRRAAAVVCGGGDDSAATSTPFPDGERWDAPEATLSAAIDTAADAAHAAMCDSVDTKTALEAVLTLAKDTQAYATACTTARRSPRALLLRRAGEVATRVLRVVGVSVAPAGGVGLGDERELPESAARAVDAVASLRDAVRGASRLVRGGGVRAALAAAAKEAGARAREQLGVNLGDGGAADAGDAAAPFIAALAALTASVRAAAGAEDDGAAAAAALTASDVARDTHLAAAGVRLEDAVGEDGAAPTSVWATDDPAALAAEAAARVAAAARDAARRAAAAADAAARDLKKLEDAAAAPTVAAALIDKYSRFDGEGNPTHAADDTALDERGLAKAKKEADKKRRARAPYETAIAADPDALAKARSRAVDAAERAAEARAAVDASG